jgi:hypothetical protein
MYRPQCFVVYTTLCVYFTILSPQCSFQSWLMIFIKGDIHPLLMYIITNFAPYNLVMENLLFITLYILHMDVMCLKICMKHI